jgi:hypothetical protein
MANKPNIKTLNASAKTFDVELPKGNVTKAAEALLDHFIETFGEDNLVECQVCKYDGPEYDADGNLVPSCPFCGTLFDAAPAEENTPPPKKEKSTKGKKGKGGQKPAKKRGKKEEEEIVPLTPEQEEELNEQIAEIKDLRVEQAKNTWQIGVRLNQINDGQLWKSLGCKSFFEFCATKLDISRSGAYKYMVAAREFSEEDFLKVGVKKADLIASAPERYRDKLMEKVTNEGASHAELKAQLNKWEGKGGGGSDKSLTLNGRIKEGDIETDWLSTNSHKPVTKRGVKNKYARVQLTDEVELFIAEADNGLGLVVNFRKITNEDDTKKKTTKPKK